MTSDPVLICALCWCVFMLATSRMPEARIRQMALVGLGLLGWMLIAVFLIRLWIGYAFGEQSVPRRSAEQEIKHNK